MDAKRYGRARELFVRAIELEPAERERYLDAECAGDADLRSELRSLIEAHVGARGFDSVDAAGASGADPTPATARMPERIGRYRILGVLGEGGMGVVYLAEQENPRRRVALKVLHPGIASPARVHRFQHEAQILGRLHHPGIAQVHEAGSEDAGAGPQPFLAMELVQGRSIVEHAAAEGLGARERIELLVQVCRAAQHAHECGVIHRDLKPANILVDEHGTPKILDFGIARASDDDLRSRTLATGVGEVLGTLPYMSPEQIGSNPGEIDARSDVYALGVVGYELLAGRLPIDLAGMSLPEAAQAVREEDPAPLGALSKALRGDLETIFARALEKERERRYGSAKELADDLERFLEEKPIVARPPSTIYQLAKFARRNRVLVGGLAAVLLALVLGILGTAWQAHRATVQRNEARNETRRAEAALQYLEDLFRSLDPNKGGKDARVLDVVREGERRLEGTFAGEPGVEASLRQTIGSAYKGLGLWEESESNFRRSVDLYRMAKGEKHRDVARAQGNLAEVLVREEKLEEAEKLLDEAEARVREELPPDPRAWIALRVARVGLFVRRGQESTAADELERLLADARRTYGEEDAVTLSLISNLADIRLGQTRLDEAYELLEEGLAVSRTVHGDEHTQTLVLAHNMAALLEDRHCFAEAKEILEHSLAVETARFGPDHDDTLATMNSLAGVVRELGDTDQAARTYEDLLRRLEAKYGASDMKTLTVANNLAVLWWIERATPDRAEEIYRREIEGSRRSSRPETPDTVQFLYSYAVFLERNARSFEADALYRELLERARAVLPPDNWWLGRYEAQYGSFLADQGCHEDALPVLEDAWSRFRAAFGPKERRSVMLLKRLIETCQALGLEERVQELKAQLPAGASSPRGS